MYVTYTRIYGWSDYGGESSYQPGYRLENMMWMTLLVYDYIIPGENNYEKYECEPCGYIYDPAVGDPDGGIAPGTAFEDIPDDWVCPICGLGKDVFVPVED